MRKLCGSIRRIAVFFMVVMLTVQTATVTPVLAEGQDNKLQVEIFVTKHDDRGTSREDFYYIGKANITYPANVSLDAIYDDANAPAQNNTVAVANLIPQNNDTQDAVANINDEQTPLAAGDENADTDTNTSNGDDKVVTTIADDDTPLAAAEDNCIIHWIILLLTLLGAGYTIIRVVLANKQEQEEENKQEA